MSKGEWPVIADGYNDVPPGKIATGTTFLELARADAATEAPPLDLQPLRGDSVARYRALFAAVGSPWLWFSRLLLKPAELGNILADPAVEAFALRHEGADIGLLELDFRGADAELAYFGLVPEATGHGFGHALMLEAQRRAFTRPIPRLIVHTCTLDHPAALGFYRRHGFRPYRLAVEVFDDPRLAGILPRDCAPQVPLIEA